MAARQVTVEFLGNSRNLTNAISSANTGTSRLGTTLKRIGKAAAIGFAAATVVATRALWEMGQAAADDEAAASQLARQLKNNTHATNEQIAAVEEWITATSLASGVADDDLRPALARLATATGSVQKAQDLLTLGMNISAGTGKELKTVTEALAKAQNGSLGGLSRLGVKIKDAAGETKTFAAIQDDLAKKFRGATAQAAETTAGKMARLKVQMQETGEAIGYKLLPYATRFANWMLNTGIPAIQKLGTWLKSHLGPAIGAVIDYFRKGTKGGDDLSSAMNDLSKFTEDVKRAWKALSPFLEKAAKDILPLLGEYIKADAKYVRTLGEAFIWMWNNALGPVLKLMLTQWANFSKVVGESMKVLSHAPGMGWMKKLGDNLVKSGEKARDLANEIRDIPDKKTVNITVNTHYTTPSGNPAGPTIPGHSSERGGSKNPTVHVGQAALEMLQQVIAAIGGKKKKLLDVLAGVRDAIATAKDNIASILEDKKAWADGFQDFLDSVFNADFTDPTTGAYTGTVDQIIAYQATQLQKALQLQSDIAALVQKGLSPALLAQMQAAGASGMAAIHTLAGASAEEIARLNSLQAQTAGALNAAGQKASDVVFKDQLKTAQDSLDALQSVNEQLTAIQEHLGKDEVAEIKLQGSTLVTVLHRVEKETGKKYLVN